MGSTLTVRHFPLPPSGYLTGTYSVQGTPPTPLHPSIIQQLMHNIGAFPGHISFASLLSAQHFHTGVAGVRAPPAPFSSPPFHLSLLRHDTTTLVKAGTPGLILWVLPTTKTGRCKGCTDLHRLIRTLTLLISSLLPRQLRGAPLSPISLRRSGVPVCAPCYALLLCWLAVQSAWLNIFAASCFREQGGHLNTGLLPSPSLHCTDQKCAD